MLDDFPMIFSGTSHPELAKEIAENIGVKLGKTQIDTFPDGEIGVQILENVRGREAFVVQSIARDPNLYLVELLIIIDALKRASASRIIGVIPHYGYGRQDRKDRGHVPVTAKLVANLLEKAGLHKLITMDLHSEQIQGFFDIPVENLHASSTLMEKVFKLGFQKFVVTAPDIGSAKRARNIAAEAGVPFAIVDKQRISSISVVTSRLIGDVQGKDVVLVDDICSTGETLKNAAKVCIEAGANRIFAAVTHGICSRNFLSDAPIDRFIITNTIPPPSEIDYSKIDVCSIAGVFAKALKVTTHVKDRALSKDFSCYLT